MGEMTGVGDNKKNILIIVESPTLAKMFAAKLKTCFYVDDVNSIFDGVKKLTAEIYDLVRL